MSGFAVLFQRDGAPLEPSELEAMMAALAHRGPDGGRTEIAAPFALGHWHFWTTPEEVGERQPLGARQGRYRLVLDGRLDNREEIWRQLGRALPEPGVSDAALALEALLAWGEGALEHLVGPFALVLCDLAEQQVLCARDALGDRTLFYRLDRRKLLVASEEGALLTHPEVSEDLNEDRLVDFFAVRTPGNGSTFFREVTELQPAHSLRVGCQDWQQRRYWRPVPSRRPSGESEAESAEHYRELLALSVSSRWRSSTPPGVMLSGGLDSGTLAALASQRPAAGPAMHRPRSFSWIFDDLVECDERRFIGPLVGLHGIEAHFVTGDGAWPLCRPDPILDPGTPEENPYRELKAGLYRAARQAGTRVLLNGGSADLFYAGCGSWWAHLVAEGRLGEALRSLGQELARHGAIGGLRRAGAGRLARRLVRRRPSLPAWLTPVARAQYVRRAEPEVEGPWPRRGQVRAVLGPRGAHGLTLEIFHASREGVELRHPYRDRRLVEFMLALPTRRLYRRGRYKPMARCAMQGLLPEELLLRRRPTLLTPLFDRGLRDRERSRVDRLLHAEGASWPRYVQHNWLERIWQEGARRPIEEVVLWHCISFELWQRWRAQPKAFRPAARSAG